MIIEERLPDQPVMKCNEIPTMPVLNREIRLAKSGIPM